MVFSDFKGHKSVYWYTLILLLKLASFPVLIGLGRVWKGVFLTEEDARFLRKGSVRQDDTIERMRRFVSVIVLCFPVSYCVKSILAKGM